MYAGLELFSPLRCGAFCSKLHYLRYSGVVHFVLVRSLTIPSHSQEMPAITDGESKIVNELRKDFGTGPVNWNLLLARYRARNPKTDVETAKQLRGKWLYKTKQLKKKAGCSLCPLPRISISTTFFHVTRIAPLTSP